MNLNIRHCYIYFLNGFYLELLNGEYWLKSTPPPCKPFVKSSYNLKNHSYSSLPNFLIKYGVFEVKNGQ